MAGVRDFLYRFRPAGAPGKASPAGLPVDRRETAAAELEPVFAALEDAVREAAGLRATAEALGRATKAGAAGRARTLVSRARDEAPQVRAGAAARVRAAAEADLVEIIAAAEHRADEVRLTAARRLPRQLADVAARARAALAAAVEVPDAADRGAR